MTRGKARTDREQEEQQAQASGHAASRRDRKRKKKGRLPRHRPIQQAVAPTPIKPQEVHP